MFAKRKLRMEPVQVQREKQVSIWYNGELASNQELYLHYGFDGWVNPRSLQMTKNPDDSFEVSLTASGLRELEFCFHTPDDLWDNNGGLNWHCEII